MHPRAHEQPLQIPSHVRRPCPACRLRGAQTDALSLFHPARPAEARVGCVFIGPDRARARTAQGPPREAARAWMLSPTPTLPSVTPCWPALNTLPPEVMPLAGLVMIGCCTEKPPLAADTCAGSPGWLKQAWIPFWTSRGQRAGAGRARAARERRRGGPCAPAGAWLPRACFLPGVRRQAALHEVCADAAEQSRARAPQSSVRRGRS